MSLEGFQEHKADARVWFPFSCQLSWEGALPFYHPCALGTQTGTTIDRPKAGRHTAWAETQRDSQVDVG